MRILSHPLEGDRHERRIVPRRSPSLVPQGDPDGAALLLILSAQNGRRPDGAPPTSDRFREVRIHGRRLAPGMLPLPRGEEEEREGGSERERLVQWIESRHRAAPGVDWHAIEAANLQASLARITETARAAEAGLA